MDARLKSGRFLWVDESPARLEKAKHGEVVAEPAQGKAALPLKGALLHDWVGATFIPGATLANTKAVVQDFAHHKDIYPEVADARILAQEGDRFTVFMRVVKAKYFLTDVLNTEQQISFFFPSPTRIYSRSYSRRIAEVANPGKADEHELPVGNDRGLLWRLNVYWFFEERDGGVLIECETISLTRDVPFGAGKLFGPVVKNVPGDSLRGSLEQTQKAVKARLKP